MLEAIIINAPQISKSKGLLITLLIILLTGGIYTGIKLLLPDHGLTGYYLNSCDTGREKEHTEENDKLQPLKILPSDLKPGIKKKIYKGNPKKQLIKETTEDSPINFVWLSDDKKPCNSPFTIEWSGILKIEKHGDYTFILGSDDGSELLLNGKRIIDNGEVHPLTEKRQLVSLEPGFYHLHLRYFDQSGGAILYLKWQYPNVSETEIPPSQFFQEATTQNFHVMDNTLPYILNIMPNSVIDQSFIVFKKNDPKLKFSNYGTLRTYYVNYWDNYRFEPPKDTSAYNILWRGSIWIPEDGTYTFKYITNGDSFLFIDAKPILEYRAGSNPETQVPLEKGWKSIQINYFNASKYATLNLLWQKPGERKSISIPSRYLKPSENVGVFSKNNMWYSVGFIVVPLLIILGIFIWLKKSIKYYIQRYFAYVKQNWSVVALIFIVILGATLRLNNYSVIPPHADTIDTYQEAWKGYHILKGEGPKTWAAFYFSSAYKDEDKYLMRWCGDIFMIVRNQIDHPPLFAILTGIPPIICGAKNYLDCRLTTINLTPIFFSTFTIILVFLVSYKIHKSNTVSVISSLTYATVPLFVAAGRLAKGDCLLALVLLTGILYVLKYAESKKKTYIVFAGFLAGISYWCKEVGICAIVILPIITGRKGFVKEAFIIAGIGVFIALGYMLYNCLVNPEAFSKILTLYNEHHMNKTKFNIIIRYITEARLAQIPATFGLGYLLWFWFAIAYSIGKRDTIIPFATFIFLMTLCAVSSDVFSYGWYFLPLYPFMAIAGGLFMRDFISKPNTAKALLILLVLVAVPLKEILPENLNNSQWLFRCYLALGILPFLVFDFLKNRITGIIAKTTCYIYISFLIIMNIYIVYHLTDLYDPLKMYGY
ncbi:MAG: hypothetical protein A2Y09_08055 [Planctomycetes bacterium GWA2_39_15]|nr:MAG: hypothetical protein A2Y09_08055 [Planctomycetes bacterium GWA2_39_15]